MFFVDIIYAKEFETQQISAVSKQCKKDNQFLSNKSYLTCASSQFGLLLQIIYKNVFRLFCFLKTVCLTWPI